MAMTDQLNDFNQRVARISKAGNTSYYDPELQMNIPKRVSKEVINRKKLKTKKNPPLLASLFLGAFALMASYMLSGRFGLIDLNAPVLVYATAGVIALLLGGLLRLKTVPHMGAQVAGVGVTITTMHNLVWMFPEQFAVIYSPEFVAMVEATTTAGSLTFMGASYVL